ncbi:DUF2304 domain-containing protein [Lachnospiraceae bacterium ASD4241]|uniref:DUF2304 domain-containing protein n=2 Tax=Diplocloster modestus TaxID=2850322 RepID=A0ABS6K168_9FIRM|nr:DUF2304 domain-containing protein [Diplocloster modestus]
MTLKLQIILGVVLILAFLLLVNMIRKKSLELKYALSWLIVIFALFILDCFPVLLDDVAGFLGIFSPVNMIFFLGFVFSLLIIFVLTIALSRISNRVRALAQNLALSTKKLEILEKKLAELEDRNEPAEAVKEEKAEADSFEM